MQCLRRASVVRETLRRSLQLQPQTKLACTQQTFTTISLLKRQSLPQSINAPFSRSVSSRSDDMLLQILDAELKYAQESDPATEDVAPDEWIPFKVQDNPGKRSIVLRRKFKKENIAVEVLGMDIGAGEVGSDEETEKPGNISVALTVNVSKESSENSLEINCIISDKVSIESLVVKRPDQDIHQGSIPYQGPSFPDLNQKLQKGLIGYLAERGISPDLTGFLAEYLMNKDSKEFTRWLQNLKWFVENKKENSQ